VINQENQERDGSPFNGNEYQMKEYPVDS